MITRKCDYEECCAQEQRHCDCCEERRGPCCMCGETLSDGSELAECHCGELVASHPTPWGCTLAVPREGRG